MFLSCLPAQLFFFSLMAVVEDDTLCSKKQQMCFDIKLALGDVPALMDWQLLMPLTV